MSTLQTRKTLFFGSVRSEQFLISARGPTQRRNPPQKETEKTAGASLTGSESLALRIIPCGGRERRGGIVSSKGGEPGDSHSGRHSGRRRGYNSNPRRDLNGCQSFPVLGLVPLARGVARKGERASERLLKRIIRVVRARASFKNLGSSFHAF